MQDRVTLLRRLTIGALDLVRRYGPDLDSLNVFPVADSDTGTNICLTFTEALAGLDAVTAPSPAEAAAALARGALLGARGNSGVILGQYLGELAVRLAGDGDGDVNEEELDAEALAGALGAAARAARGAVARPVEGTVLTVADDVARAAREAVAAGGSSVGVVEAALAEGRRSVGRTPGQLDVLASAGVEDAGGWGLVLVLEALRAAVAGAEVGDVSGPSRRHRAQGPTRRACAGTAHAGHVEGEAGVGHSHDQGADGEFELMAVARTDDVAAMDVLRAGLDRLGQSLAVVGRAGLWQVHVHTDDVVEAIELLLAPRLGVRQVVVRHLLALPPLPPLSRPGVVMVTGAAGLVAELARSGAVVLLAEDELDGEALVRAIEDTGQDEVLVLAHGSRSLPDRLLPDVEVRLRDRLDAGHLVAAAASLGLVTEDAAAAEALHRVERAVGAVRTATVAADASEPVGPGRHDRLVDVARGLLAELGSASAEVLTVVTSRETPGTVVPALREGLSEVVEVVVLEGGAPGTAVVLGAEPAP